MGCGRGWLGAFLLVLGTACGGGGDGTTEPPDNQSITVAVSPSSLSIVAGTSTDVTVSVTRGGGFEGLIALVVEGAPTGVSATMSPTPPLPNGTTSATVTVTAASTTTPGTYTVTVRASGSGVTTKTATFTLTVTAPPSFSLSATAAGSITQGQNANSTVTITRGGGFAAGVSLTLESPVAGITATFNPNPATLNTSVATINVAASTTPGSYTLTVRGTSTGMPEATATIPVTVVADQGNFSLSLSPNALSIVQGTNANTTVNVTRIAPFTGSVTLSLENAPAGVTGSFATNPATTSSVLTVTVGAAVAAGNYNLTVRGSVPGSSVVGDEAQPAIVDQTVALTLTVTLQGDYTLAATNAAIAQGANGPSTVSVNRTGGFAGNVALTLENAPNGVSGVFAPNPATGNTSTLTLTVGGAVTVGAHVLTVRGTVVGRPDKTTTFTLTVSAPGSFTLSAVSNALNITAGTNGGTTININRTNGYAGSVTITHTTNAPGGVVIGFAPSPTTGNTSSMTVTVGGGVAPGVYSITVRGNAAGITEQTTVVQLTVTAGGSGNVTWTFCAQSGLAVWLAFQDGAAGTWTAVTPTGNTFNFNIAQGKGAVAWVTTSGARAQGMITYGSLAELQASSPSCSGAGTTKTLNAKITNMPNGQFASVSVGGGFRTINFNDVAQPVTGVRDGLVDAVVTTAVFFPPSVGKFLVRRQFNLADGATMPDFHMGAGSPEAVDPVARTVTVGNTAGGTLAAGVTLITAGGGVGTLYNPINGAGGNTVTFYTLPAPIPGDLHMLAASEIQGAFTSRTVTKLFNASADQNVTLGDFAPPWTLSFTTAGYVRPRAQFTVPATLNRLWNLNWTNRGGNQNSWTIQVWEGYAMGTTIDYQVPDFSAVTGWQNAWGIQAGTGFATDGTIVLSGWTIGVGAGQQPRAEGSIIFTATRTEPINP